MPVKQKYMAKFGTAAKGDEPPKVSFYEAVKNIRAAHLPDSRCSPLTSRWAAVKGSILRLFRSARIRA